MSNTPSIKRNFVYRSILTLSSYVMGFITFPYVSRVLGVEKVGLIDFVDNTIAYFLLFGTMGVSILGVREIAAVKDNNEDRDRVFSNIFGLNLCFTVIVLIIYILLVITIPQLRQYSELFYIGSAKILFTLFLAEWFFAGIENFRYITLRSVTIKTIYVISIFLFIKEPGDYKLYFLLTVLSVVLNGLINFIYVSKIVSLDFKSFFNTVYIKRNFILGAYNIMSAMYLTFNVMFLGLMTNNVQVGYYTTAHKIYTVTLGFFSAFTNVMMPRMSSLLANGDNDQFRELISKSFRAMCTFALPIITCTIVLAPQIIYVISGAGYEGAVTPMRIIMPAVLFVGIAQVLAVQVLTPMKKDKVLFRASIVGSIVSISINMAAVSSLECIGSALVLLCSEMAVTTTYVIYILRHPVVTIPFESVWKNLMLAIPAIIVCIACKSLLNNPFVIVGIAVPVAILVWAGVHRCIADKNFV